MQNIFKRRLQEESSTDNEGTKTHVPFVYRLGHSSFKAERRVQFSQGILLEKTCLLLPNIDGSTP